MSSIAICLRGKLSRLLGILIVFCLSRGLWAELPHTIIFIGDGMGFEQVKAAGLYAHGSGGAFFFESLPYRGELTTHSASASVTDSAAAATAIATGFKVNNGVISMAYPGDGSELLTLLEHYKAQGRSTGLVTTTYMTHATPAGFGAHEPSRDRLSQIAADYLQQTRPDVLLGGGGNGLSPADALSAGYSVVESRSDLLALDTEQAGRLSGQFGASHLPYELDGLGNLPHLSEMTAAALNILDNNPQGFFLLVEGGRIDHACHDNNLARAVHEVIELDNAIQVAMDWAQGRSDTLILVTADHETGGLTVLADNGIGEYPAVSWSTGGHTGVNVPIFGWGVNADQIGGVLDNTELFEIVTVQPTEEPPAGEFLDALTGGELPVAGTISNDHTATWANDGVYEEITEVLSGGRKPASQRSVLEHKWVFDVAGGSVVSFHAKAHHTANNEGDEFLFSYSTDDLSYTPLLMVMATSPDDGYLSYSLPTGLRGTLYIRVTDADATKGNAMLDTLSIDHLYIRSSNLTAAPGLAAQPRPADGATEVPLHVDLQWTVGDGAGWHNVHFGADPGNLVLVSQEQEMNVYPSGPLEPNRVYFWRIDEVNRHGISTGLVWSFRTSDGSCLPETMFAESVTLDTLRGDPPKRFGKATVMILDECGEAVPGALVTGHFTGDFEGLTPPPALTGEAGTVEFLTTTQLKQPSFSFVVDSVIRDGLQWTP